MISCDQCREELAEYALANDDRAHSSAMSEHLAACPTCRQELAELQEAWAALPLALQPVLPPANLFERVLQRIDGGSLPAKSQQVLTKPAASHLTRRQRIASYVVAATVLVGLTVGYLKFTRPGRDEALAKQSAERLAERLGNVQQMEQLLKSDSVRLVSLHRPDSSDKEQAVVLWDLSAGQWHVFASDLPPIPDGAVYQLWASQTGGQLHAGPILKVNDKGIASGVVDFPDLNPALPSRAIVTVEPAGGSKKPTGKVVLEAAL